MRLKSTMAILLRSTRRVVRNSCKSLGTAVLVVLFLLDTAVTGIFLGLLWNAVVRSPQGCASAASVSRICGQSGAAFMSVLLMPFTLHWVVWTCLDLQATFGLGYVRRADHERSNMHRVQSFFYETHFAVLWALGMVVLEHVGLPLLSASLNDTLPAEFTWSSWLFFFLLVIELAASHGDVVPAMWLLVFAYVMFDRSRAHCTCAFGRCTACTFGQYVWAYVGGLAAIIVSGLTSACRDRRALDTWRGCHGKSEAAVLCSLPLRLLVSPWLIVIRCPYALYKHGFAAGLDHVLHPLASAPHGVRAELLETQGIVLLGHVLWRPQQPTTASADAPTAGSVEISIAVSTTAPMPVLCPPNARAGDCIKIVAPGGQAMQVVVPAAVSPGAPFLVEFPASSSSQV